MSLIKSNAAWNDKGGVGKSTIAFRMAGRMRNGVLGSAVSPNGKRCMANLAVLAMISSLFLAALCAHGASDAASIRIQYRELVDDSIYGHSGRPASTVLSQLALGTPRGIAKTFVVKVLQEKISALKKDIAEAEAAKNAAVSKKKNVELRRAEAILEDEERLAEEIDSCLTKNRLLLGSYSLSLAGKNKALLSDVEPVCEPVGFVLNDALAQRDAKTLNPDLTELAFFYPQGEVEAGWVDLIRMRRFVVYTDGKSYCRLFLPGDNAEQAWKSAFPVVRHVLLSLLKPGATAEKLTVDVYAYTNDIAETTFTLALPKHTLMVTAQDLGVPAGLRPLDLAALAKFFADGQILEGCGIDTAGQLVLVGSKGKTPTLDGHPVELSDLAVAYRASAYAGHGESYMSLDKTGDDDFVNVNFGGRLYDTRMGWVAYRCDMRFKTLGDDYDAVTFENLGPMICGKMQDYSSQQRRYFADPSTRSIASEDTRFWFYPDDFKVVTSADGKACLVTRPRFTAAAERRESYDQAGGKMDSRTPPWTSLTLDHFNRNYDKFAELFPEVGELDHAARLLGVAEWLQQANQKGIAPLDLAELLTIPLPVNPTPRRREQLRIIYAVRKTGIPAEFKAYCVSTPEGQAKLKQDLEEYLKPTSEWKIMSVVAGGLDFSARKAVQEAAAANKGQESILRKSMTTARPFKVSDGREMCTSAAIGGKGPPPEPPKGIVTASAPEPGPKGIGFDGTTRRFRNTNGNVVDSLVAEESGVKRLQKSGAEAFYKAGAMHSVWVNEHGSPERFAESTTKGVITYRLVEEGGAMTAKLVRGERTPTEGELDFLGAALAENNMALSQAWSMAPVDAEITAIDMTPGKEALVLYQEKGGDVLRIYKAGAKPSAVNGDDALARLHESSREKVRAFSVPGKVELFHVAGEGEDVVLQIGRRDPIRLKKVEWGNWLNAGVESAPPAPLVPVYNELIKSDAELVVMRDALQSRPQRLGRMGLSFRDVVGVMTMEQNSREIDLLRLTDKELQAQIDAINKAIATKVPSIGSKRALSRIKEIQSMNAAEKAKLLASRAQELNDEMGVLRARQSERDAVSLAGVLKTKFQKLRVSYDDPSPLTPERVMREPMVKSATDVGLAVPPGEAGVDDKGILRTVAAAFDQARIPLIKSPADLERVANVIVVTAHNNEALFDYVQSLGEYQINGRSALYGKFLMLSTCFEEGNPNMVSELLRRYNCAGVFVQSERVNKDAVRRVLVEFSKTLRDLKPGAPAQRLRDLFDESVKRVLRRDDPGVDESLKKELEKLLRARVQWCALPRSESNGPRLQEFLLTTERC